MGHRRRGQSIAGTSSSVIGYGGAFQVQTADAASIAKVVLDAHWAVTHAFDMDQRHIWAIVQRRRGRFECERPPNGNIAPRILHAVHFEWCGSSFGGDDGAGFAGSERCATHRHDHRPASDVTITAGTVCGLFGTGTDPDGTINGYSWSFPGGNPSTSKPGRIRGALRMRLRGVM